MYPYNISSQEVYGKHRHSDEVREIERQNQVIKARSYRYGDPVNSKVENDEFPAENRLSKRAGMQRRSGEVPLLARIIISFLPFLRPR